MSPKTIINLFYRRVSTLNCENIESDFKTPRREQQLGHEFAEQTLQQPAASCREDRLKFKVELLDTPGIHLRLKLRPPKGSHSRRANQK